MALSNLKERTGREAILKKYEKLMAEKFVRTEPLGSGRDGRRYWVFEGDTRYGSTVPAWFGSGSGTGCSHVFGSVVFCSVRLLLFFFVRCWAFLLHRLSTTVRQHTPTVAAPNAGLLC